jgi:CHAT domain-containing protein
MALLAGDEIGAFNVAEQQRARSLLDEFSKGPASATQFATPLTALEIQDVLANDSAIIEYAILPHSVVAFVLRHGRMRVVSIAPSSDSVTQAGNRLTTAAEQGEDLVAAGTAGYVALLQPLLPEINDARRLVFVAPPDLAKVPFAALHDPVSNHFLIETASILEAPSATLAITAARRGRGLDKPRVLAIAASRFDFSSFPGAQSLQDVGEQAKRVAAAYGDATILGGDRATRSEVLRVIGNYDVVDVAGHAIVPSTGDRDAMLLLAPEASGRSFLRASEIAHLRLPAAKLVVLGACRSAATGSHNEQNENLALAFIAAGASTVVATTTNLDDEDALRLLPRFHGLIAAGLESDEALRSTLSAAIRDAAGHIRAKCLWASVKLIGGTADLLEMHSERTTR